MSKMSDMAMTIEELRSAAAAINEAASWLAEQFSSNEPFRVAKPTPAPKQITLEQVRAVLAEKSRDGYTAAVRALLEKHGASKLSEIDPAEYPHLLAEAEALGNG